MIRFHIFYFITTFIAVTVPTAIFLKTKKWETFAVIFPFFYFIYSFVGPLSVIFGYNFENITRSHFVIQEIFSIYDCKEVYAAHVYYLVFYLMWFLGFYASSNFRIKVSYDPIKIDEPMVSPTTLVLIIIVFLSVPVLMLIFNFGFDWSGVYGRGTRLLYSKYSTFYKGFISLAGSGILCFSALTFFRLGRSKKDMFSVISLTVILVFYIGFSMLVGDRSQLFVVLIGGTILFSLLYRKTFFSSKFLFVLCIIFPLNTFIRVYRGKNLELLFNGDFSRISVGSILLSPFVSGESFAAYASLPFLIANRIPHIYGSSFIYLLVSFVPRFISNFRPPAGYIYSLYAFYAGLLSSHRGYTFHHVADWYWNFGALGVTAGGYIIGYLMGKLEKKALNSTNLFWMVVFASTAGHLPRSIRDSIEGVKSVFYLYWVLPLFIFFLLKRIKNKF